MVLCISNAFEPISVDYDDIFKNDIISKFKSEFKKLKYFNNYSNIREIGNNLAIFNTKIVKLNQISSLFFNQFVSHGLSKNAIYSIESYEVLNRYKLPYPILYGIYNNLETNVSLVTSVNNSITTLSEYMKLNKKLSSKDKCNLLIRLTKIIIKFYSKFSKQSCEKQVKEIIPFLNFNQKLIVITSNAKYFYFTEVISPYTHDNNGDDPN